VPSPLWWSGRSAGRGAPAGGVSRRRRPELPLDLATASAVGSRCSSPRFAGSTRPADSIYFEGRWPPGCTRRAGNVPPTRPIQWARCSRVPVSGDGGALERRPCEYVSPRRPAGAGLGRGHRADLPAAPAARADGVTAALLPDSGFVSPGSEFTLDLWVTAPGDSFNCYDAVIEYDPTVLTFLQTSPPSLQEGAYMKLACGKHAMLVHERRRLTADRTLPAVQPRATSRPRPALTNCASGFRRAAVDLGAHPAHPVL